MGWDIPLDVPEAWLAALQEAADADQQTFNAWSEKCRALCEGPSGPFGFKGSLFKII